MTTTAHRLDTALVPVPPSERSRLLGATSAIVAALAVGVVAGAVLLSPLHHARDQRLARADLRYDLANGTAPVGQVTPSDELVAPGTPVAILQIPRLGVDEVVLEGTTSSVLKSGAGHRRDTVLPGQAGPSVLMGRANAYGGVLGRIDQLRPGDTVRTTTGQGEATFTVTGVRRAGDPLPDPLGPGDGRLTLVSASGARWLPDELVRVDAELVTPSFPTPVSVLAAPVLGDDEQAFVGQSSAWPTFLLGLTALAAAAVLLVVMRRWWGRWQAWVVGLPVVALCAALTVDQLFSLLPNLV
ncbi:sortase [Cellulomonas gilvus]|uniref:Peptidase C60 sortase A and B n=1 Tax=Cellulomonas gilvus (strain ATCC 13127 / NRRL B-14078) TaxID=593907 RepID=F8A255_CELGA|nr:sortase [Cellulomonas gilvus]AEI10575.1 peptidase C60 sortase A and B [Cellulomonas gilvus ATCC 13127]